MSNLTATITIGHQVGKIMINLNQKPIMTVPLIAMESVGQSSWWHRIFN